MSKDELTKTQLRELLTEQSYTVEALEDELEGHLSTIDYLAEKIDGLTGTVNDLSKVNKDVLLGLAKAQERIVELIHENDRLTLAYEPYRPPGDEDEELTFYGLKEENDSFMHNILDKIAVIQEQDSEIRELHNQIHYLQRTLQVNTPEPKKIRKTHAGVLSFDFWPASDWFRFNLYRWNPGKAFQLTIGPVRFDWFES